MEFASIVAFVAVWGGVLFGLFDLMAFERLVWILPVSLVLGLAAADFVGGAVHWFADTYFDPATPILGRLLIEPFREHHRDPQGITHHGFLELSGNNALATLPIGVGLLALEAPGQSAVLQSLHASVTALALALFVTNSFHCWAHMQRPPVFAGWLHRWGLAIAPGVHAVHHRAAHDCSYCVTSGWLNPLLDRFDFFRRVEAALAVIGLEARRGDGPMNES